MDLLEFPTRQLYVSWSQNSPQLRISYGQTRIPRNARFHIVAVLFPTMHNSELLCYNSPQYRIIDGYFTVPHSVGFQRKIGQSTIEKRIPEIGPCREAIVNSPLCRFHNFVERFGDNSSPQSHIFQDYFPTYLVGKCRIT